ncbi:hypothetical protein [Vreelandella zhuhanensis]|nr:hypothetical protein [Halomonas zhuhanensis]
MVTFDRDAGLLGVEAGESFFGEQEGQMTEPVSARVEALKASLVG